MMGLIADQVFYNPANRANLRKVLQADDGHSESHLVTAECIKAWLAAGNTPLPYEPQPVDLKEQAKADLGASDKEMARIAEDLINTLIAKGVIDIKDLPKPATDKLAERAELRKALKS